MSSVNATQFLAAAKIASKIDWAGMIASFESQSTEEKIVNGMIAADDVAEIVGVFFPPVAVVANDVEIAIEVEQFAEPMVEWLIAQPATQQVLAKIPPPAKPGPRQILIQGHVFDIPAWEFEPGAVFPPNQG